MTFNIPRQTVALLALLLLPAFPGKAEVLNGLEPLSVSLHPVFLNSSPERYAGLAVAGTNRFAFELNSGFSLGGDPANGRLLIESIRTGTYFTFKIHAPGSGGNGTPTAADLQANYPNAKGPAPVERFVLGGNRRGFDIEWSSAEGVQQKTRVLLIPTSAGALEISLTSGREQFRDSAIEFDCFLHSLRLNADEKSLPRSHGT